MELARLLRIGKQATEKKNIGRRPARERAAMTPPRYPLATHLPLFTDQALGEVG
jgi:hypothetical protein